MDDKSDKGMDGSDSGTSDFERSAEEMAWDREFEEPKKTDFLSGITEFAKLAVQVPVTIVTTPFRLIPEETTRHGRAAVRESFLAMRSLLGAVGDGIERILADPDKQAEESGVPDGTWGTRPTSRQPSTGSKARRIALTDSDADSPVDMEDAAQIAIDAQAAEEEEEVGEGRGLRADIEY
jgi:hypothetical protein